MMLPASKKRAFSIMEVLLVLALMAMVAGLFAVNFDVLLSSLKQRSPEKVFRGMVREARYQASQQHQDTFLSFHPENGYRILNREGTEIVKMESEEGLSVVFYSIPLDLVYGPDLGLRKNSEIVPMIHFSPDGSSTPVIVEFKLATGSARYRLDPLSTNLIAEQAS